MPDTLLLESILDRLGKVDDKIDGLRDAVHKNGLGEVSQRNRLDKIETRMDSFENTLNSIAKRITVQVKSDDAASLTKGLAAGLRMASSNHKLLWVIIGFMGSCNLIETDTARKLVGFTIP